MLWETAIIGVRKCLGIPDEGLPSEGEALAWYREHFKQTKGEEMEGTFGFQYDQRSGLVNFEYEAGSDFFCRFMHPSHLITRFLWIKK